MTANIPTKHRKRESAAAKKARSLMFSAVLANYLGIDPLAVLSDVVDANIRASVIPPNGKATRKTDLLLEKKIADITNDYVIAETSSPWKRARARGRLRRALRPSRASRS